MIEPAAFLRALKEVDDGATPEDTYAKFMSESAEQDPDDFRDEMFIHNIPACEERFNGDSICAGIWSVGSWTGGDFLTSHCSCQCHGEPDL